MAGIGTGGTISGTGHYLKDVSNGAVQVIGADPEGSIYSDPNDVHQYQIEASARTSIRRPLIGAFPTRSCRSPTRKPSK